MLFLLSQYFPACIQFVQVVSPCFSYISVQDNLLTEHCYEVDAKKPLKSVKNAGLLYQCRFTGMRP